MKTVIIEKAKELGICAEGYSVLSHSTVNSMVDYYIQNPDWCMERNFPSLSILKQHFSDIGHRGVFVGRAFKGEILKDSQVYIFHNCKGTVKVGLNVEKSIIPMLYICNQSHLRIIGVGDNIPIKPVVVPVYVFGDNEISARGNRYVLFNIFNEDIK